MAWLPAAKNNKQAVNPFMLTVIYDFLKLWLLII